jgi:hypothetical protein
LFECVLQGNVPRVYTPTSCTLDDLRLDFEIGIYGRFMRKIIVGIAEGFQQVLQAEIPISIIVAIFIALIGYLIGFPDLPLAIIILFFLLPNNFLNSSRSIISEMVEVKSIKQEREKIIERIEKDDSVIDVIRLNLNQITEYYTINKNQAKRSFNFSTLVILLGFITIIAAILLPFLKENQKPEISIISAISGMLLQFIGGANFVLYNRTVEQSNRFYKQLARIQDTMLAVELCKQVKDPEKNLQLMDKLITTLIERSSSGIESDFSTTTSPSRSKKKLDLPKSPKLEQENDD